MDLSYYRARMNAENACAATATASTAIIAHKALARAYQSRIAKMEAVVAVEASR